MKLRTQLGQSKCIDIPSNDQRPGAQQLVQWECNNGDNQKFLAEPAGM